MNRDKLTAMNDDRFCRAVDRMERATRKVTAAAIVDPHNPKRWGRVVLLHGDSRCTAIAWLPGIDDSFRHCRYAQGYGYDKETAAMSDARFVTPAGVEMKIKDCGERWRSQLEAAGFLVIQVC